MNADGSGQKRLTFADTTSDVSPSWYPDGHIVFVKSWQGGSAIYRMNDDGTSPACIESSLAGSYYAPRVSPDGTKIVYGFGDTNGVEHIWVVNADGSSPVQLTNAPDMDRHPDWSPDGARIVFAHEAPNAAWRIYTMRSDGADTLMLAPSYPDFQYEPRWSPDGSKIAFTGQSGSGYQWIYLMNSDGSLGGPLIALVNSGPQAGPCWSPDGLRLAFSILLQQGLDVYEVGRDGRGFVRVSNVPGHNYAPDWGKPPH